MSDLYTLHSGSDLFLRLAKGNIQRFDRGIQRAVKLSDPAIESTTPPTSEASPMTGEPPAKPMTPEDVIRRIAAECAYVDKSGAVGIRLQPAAAIVRQYGDQCRQTALPQAHSPRRPARSGSARQPTSLLPVFDGGLTPTKPRGPGN